MIYTATFKVKVVLGHPSPPPPPPFVGTTVKVNIPADSLGMCIYRLDCTSDGAAITIDWGDGTIDKLIDGDDQGSHTYAQGGEYTIRISDDVQKLQIAGSDTDYFDFDKIVGVKVNATNLTGIYPRFCGGCTNLRELDLMQMKAETLEINSFRNCTSFTGEIFLPSIKKIKQASFQGANGGITKFHFAKENEASILACAAFTRDRSLGTGTAESVFDL